jgi:hypothetical protein
MHALGSISFLLEYAKDNESHFCGDHDSCRSRTTIPTNSLLTSHFSVLPARAPLQYVFRVGVMNYYVKVNFCRNYMFGFGNVGLRKLLLDVEILSIGSVSFGDI